MIFLCCLVGDLAAGLHRAMDDCILKAILLLTHSKKRPLLGVVVPYISGAKWGRQHVIPSVAELAISNARE